MNPASYLSLAVLSLLALMAAGAAINGKVENIIEARLFVDPKAFSRWKTFYPSASDADVQEKIKTFINSAFVGLNDIFSGMESSGVSIQARILGIQFADASISIDAATADTNAALKKFKTWLETKKPESADHYILFTGVDLTSGGSKDPSGAAFTGEMCKELDSVSAVEFVPSGETPHTLAHEIGHSLGASHDGDGNDCGGQWKVMQATLDANHLSANTFQFSSCSINTIKAFLQDSSNNECLRTTSGSKSVEGKPMGQQYDPDTICRMKFGQQSMLNRNYYGAGSKYTLGYSDLCSGLWCVTSITGGGSSKSTKVGATDGFSCGNGKICSLGSCTASPNAPAVDDTCPYGDAADNYIVGNGMNCKVLFTTYSKNNLCGMPQIKRPCCKSCL